LPNKRFNYGYGRAEDLAGLLIVVSILATGIYVGYESITRLSDPPEIDYIWVVAAAAIIGFIGNEAVALFRMKIGKEIGSAALVADGHHARVDGLTSLAVLFGAVGVWLGFPLADPIVGLVISAAILRIVVETSKSLFSRLLDGVEPEVPDEVRNVALVTDGVRGVAEVRVRWLGHKMLAEMNIAEDVHHQLLHNLKYLSNATVHVDPVGLAGEEYQRHGIGNTEHQESHVDEHEEHGHSYN
jgi:cation diffusion facilitator family transporter